MNEFPFDEGLQLEVFRAVLDSPAHLSQTPAEAFTDPLLTRICQLSQRYLRDYRMSPTATHLKHLLSASMNGDTLPRAAKIVDDVFSLPPHPFPLDALLSFLRFSEIQRLTSDLTDALESNKTGLFDRSDAFEILHRADQIYRMEAVDTADEPGVLENIEGRVYDRCLDQPESIPTLYPELDRRTRGGAARGTLNLLLGATGHGKSVWMLNFAVGAVAAGYKVLYVTIEMSRDQLLERADRRIGGLTWEELRYHPAASVAKLQEATRRYSRGGVLKVKYMSAPTVAVVREHMRTCELQGCKFDMVVVDYGDLMTPLSFQYAERRHHVEAVYVELRELSLSENVAVWSPSQVNREGAKRKSQNMTHIAEGWGKNWIADLVLVASDGPGDEIHLTGDKVREGQKGWTLRYHADFSRMILREDRERPEVKKEEQEGESDGETRRREERPVRQLSPQEQERILRQERERFENRNVDEEPGSEAGE